MKIQLEHPWKVTKSLQLEVGKFDNYFLGFCDMLKRMCGLVMKPIPHIQCSQQQLFQSASWLLHLYSVTWPICCSAEPVSCQLSDTRAFTVVISH